MGLRVLHALNIEERDVVWLNDLEGTNITRQESGDETRMPVDVLLDVDSGESVSGADLQTAVAKQSNAGQDI